MSAPQTIFDLFFSQTYRCHFCNTYRDSKKKIRDHVRQWHKEAVEAEVKKQTEDQA